MNLTLEHYQSSFENLHDAIMVSQCKGGHPVVFINEKFTELTGYTQEDVLEKPFHMLYTHQEIIEREAVIMEGTMKQRSSSLTNVNAYKKDGSVFPVQVSISQIKNARGRTTHYISIIRDMTLQVALEKRLFAENAKLLAEKDALTLDNKYDNITGLLNRHALNNEVKGLFAGCRRAKEFFTLFSINLETHEDQESDSHTNAIKSTAELLRHTLHRESDILLKYSDTSFLICFTGQDSSTSEVFANKIITMFEEHKATTTVFENSYITIGLVSDIPKDSLTINDYILSAQLNTQKSSTEGSVVVNTIA